MAVYPSPRNFLRTGGSADASPVVACIGDSLTQGTMSADYVGMLATRPTLAGYRFVNAGIDGDLASDVVARLDEVIACRPDAATLLIGINDLLFGSAVGLVEGAASWAGPLSMARRRYLQGVDTILTRLKAETDARIAVLDLPVLGGEFAELNPLVRDYNADLAELVKAHGAALLPLHEALLGLPPNATIHTDGLHFEDAAGEVIADLVEGFLLRPA